MSDVIHSAILLILFLWTLGLLFMRLAAFDLAPIVT